MSAIQGPVIPDIVTSSQRWAVKDWTDCAKLLNEILERLYLGVWPRYADRDNEWSGPGVYRLQVRINRPEGRPLYSLKWDGPV